jgi:hypothetical protein
MAITQVANPASVPAAVADYEAQNAHISAFNNIVNNQPFILTNSGGTGLPAIKLGTYIQYGGNLYVVDTEDYAITGTPVDGNNYIRLSGSTTLTAEWVQNISSYVWNEVYGYKESGSYFLLPYLVVKSGTSYEKYSMGAVTVQYKMNQNVRTTDSPTFADFLVPTNFVVAGNTNYYGVAVGEETSGSGASAFNKSFVAPCAGSFRCVSTIESTYFSGSSYAYMSMIVAKNGSEVYRYDSNSTETVTKTYDVSFNIGDVVRLYVYLRAASSTPNPGHSGTDIYFRATRSKLASSLYDNMFVFY